MAATLRDYVLSSSDVKRFFFRSASWISSTVIFAEILEDDVLIFLHMYKWSVKELHKMLHWCNGQLKQFNHVNKKALDQHVNLTEKQEELQIRQAELEASDEVLRYLILMLKFPLLCLLFLR
ncbi:structural maintenance of chromosomes protein 3-like isoform X1 [Populus alba]|uniref:structural maintenance of chromosomes protein 3-like isoform X1 n=1 Tax=Populus alba TaxID=43335 RepID=UPI003CC78781